MTSNTLTTRRSSLICAAFRLVRVRDERGLVYLQRREIGTLRQLYARPYSAVMTAPKRGLIRSSASRRTQP
jgi:hypothetical protein